MARVAMSVGRSLAGVVTPIYLALLGFSAFDLSIYVMAVALVSALLSALIGLSSDQIGRKPFLVVMPLFAGVAGVTFAFTGAVPVLFAVGALGSFGRGAGAGAGAVGPYQPAESALVTEIVSPRYRNAAFGRLAFGSSAGASIGGLLALVVSSSHVHGPGATALFRPAFLAIAALSAAAGLIALRLTEPRPGRSSDRADSPVDGRVEPDPTGAAPATALGDGSEGDPDFAAASGSPKRMRLPKRSRWLLYRLWATNTVNGLAVGMFGPFVTYWLFRRYGAGPGEIGTLFAVINALTMASALSAAGLARRWGLVRTIFVVRMAQALLIIPMVLAPSFILAGGFYLVRMVVQRVGMPLRQSYAIGLADPGERASVAALSNVPSQIAMAGSPLLTGYLFDEVSLSLPFEIAAGLQFVNATTFWAFFHGHPPEEERRRDGAAPNREPKAELGRRRDIQNRLGIEQKGSEVVRKHADRERKR
ncbi:MAG: MFS transporter [Acidimicrobiales bacterium]